jgi:hypothetical protein
LVYADWADLLPVAQLMEDMMIGSNSFQQSAFDLLPVSRSVRHHDVGAQRRSLFVDLIGGEVLAALAVSAAIMVGAGTVGGVLAVAAPIAAGLCRYVEIMFRLAYLNSLPYGDGGLLGLAARARRIGALSVGVFFAAVVLVLAGG